MFTEIGMINFKSWRDTGAIRMAPLTGFFGANSSGKSSLLQMLLLLKQTAESNDRGLVLKTGSIQPGYVNLGTPQEITFGDTTELTMRLGWNLDAQIELAIPIPGDTETLRITELRFETTIRAEPQRIHVKSHSYRHSDKFLVCLTRQDNNRYSMRISVIGTEPLRPQGRPHVLIQPEKCYGFSPEAFLYYVDANYLSDLEFALEQQMRSLHYLGPLRDYPQRTYSWNGEKPTDVGLKGELAIHALLAGAEQSISPKSRGRYSRLMPRVAKCLLDLELAANFDIRRLADGGSLYQVWLKHQKESPETLLPDLGIGVSQVLPVLVLCYYVPVGSTIILEQPELHLHPSVQAGLADVFIDVIQRRNVQIIIESHSEHFLRRLQLRIAEQKLEPQDTALYFCAMENGKSELTPLEVNLFGEIRNWPQDFFGDMTGDVVETVKAGYERKLEQSRALQDS